MNTTIQEQTSSRVRDTERVPIRSHRIAQVDISFIKYVRSFVIKSPTITTHTYIYVIGLIRPNSNSQDFKPNNPSSLINPSSKLLLLLPKRHIQMIRSPTILVLRLLVGVDAGARDSLSFACI
jgi:hypothetical protein